MKTLISILSNSWSNEALQEKAELNFGMHIWGIGGA